MMLDLYLVVGWYLAPSQRFIAISISRCCCLLSRSLSKVHLDIDILLLLVSRSLSKVHLDIDISLLLLVDISLSQQFLSRPSIAICTTIYAFQQSRMTSLVDSPWLVHVRLACLLANDLEHHQHQR